MLSQQVHMPKNDCQQNTLRPAFSVCSAFEFAHTILFRNWHREGPIQRYIQREGPLWWCVQVLRDATERKRKKGIGERKSLGIGSGRWQAQKAHTVLKSGSKICWSLLMFCLFLVSVLSSQWSSFPDDRLNGLMHQSTHFFLQIFFLLSTASPSSAPAANTAAHTGCCVITTKLVVTTNYQYYCIAPAVLSRVNSFSFVCTTDRQWMSCSITFDSRFFSMISVSAIINLY